MSSIFVSHSHEDNAWCRAFVADLRTRGADAWYDEHNMGFGALREEIERELRSRPVFIVVLSPAAITSRWVARETDAAIHLQDQQSERIILPVVAQTCDVPLLWLTYKRVSGPGDTGLTPQEAARRVVHVLGIQPPAPVTPSVFPPVAAPMPKSAPTSPASPTPTATPVIVQQATPVATQPPTPKRLPQSRKGRWAVHAITDLYDEERHTFLVQYPTWLVLLLIITGIIAIAITAFLGYTNSEPLSQPLLLFLWFCLLLMLLQISIFRDASLRAWLIATLVVSLLAIIFIGITYFNQSLPEILRNLLQQGRFLRFLAGNQWIYTVVNFGLIGMFWFYTARRWVRRARGLAPNLGMDIGLNYEGSSTRDLEMPLLQELISGDLIVAAVLTLLLSFIFEPQIISLFIHPQGIEITNCTVSWPIGACIGYGAGPANPPTLSFIDLVQTLLYLPLGLLILLLSVAISGLGALQGVNDHYSHESLIMQRPNPTGTGAAATGVTETITDTLKSAVNRRPQLLLTNMALAFRRIGWPALLFIATYCLAELATTSQAYLHSHKQLQDILYYVLPALCWALAAVVGVVLSAALMLFHFRLVTNTARFLGLVAFIGFLAWWIPSFMLWGFNQMFIFMNVSNRTPFTPPDLITFFSLILFVIFGVSRTIARMRR
jgi:hypothetical protein